MHVITKTLALSLLLSNLSFFTAIADTKVQNNTAKKSQQVTVIPHYKSANYDKEIKALYAAQQKTQQPIAQKIDYFSAAFLQQPYVGGALGEGPTGRFDKSPLYRTDGFDCLTLVSTVLALVNANDLYGFKQEIKKVRYKDAKVAYRNRNHFTSIDWNVNNAKRGLVKDITKNIKDEDHHFVAQTATAYINKQAWYHKKPLSSLKLFSLIKPKKQQQLLQHLHQQMNYVENQQSHLPYIPLKRLFDKNGQPVQFLFNQIPSGSIIEIVRPNWNLMPMIGTHLNVSHLGFALRTKKGLVYREASSVENKVIDIPLVNYLKQYINSPTVKGINVQIVLNRR